MKHYGDITKISGYEVPIVDVITGGSPCQDLSVAGKRAGLDGERSGLFMEQIRIVKEMREHDRTVKGSDVNIRPRYMVWENVPGAFSSNQGKDFQAVLTEIVRIAEPDAPDVPMPEKRWTKSGCIYDDMGRWSVAWRVHDAQFWGVPQRRKRIALVADFAGLSAAEILFERKGLRGDFAESGEEGQGAAGSVESGTNSTSVYGISELKEPLLLESNQNHATIQTDGVSTTLPASMGMGGGYVPIVVEPTVIEMTSTSTLLAGKSGSIEHDVRSAEDFEGGQDVKTVIRRLTPLECERLQGFPDGWTDIGEWTDTKGKKHKDADSPRYKALGNSIALPFWAYLARRICAQYERNITMASLFDGIGGFPLVFERSGAKAVWASEIEEFPIAVTKKHFPEVEE